MVRVKIEYIEFLQAIRRAYRLVVVVAYNIIHYKYCVCTSPWCASSILITNIRFLEVICMLTLNLLNFLNGLFHLPVLELSITVFGYIKMRIWSWSANSIELGQTHSTANDIKPGQTALPKSIEPGEPTHPCNLAMQALYCWRLITFSSRRIRVNQF